MIYNMQKFITRNKTLNKVWKAHSSNKSFPVERNFNSPPEPFHPNSQIACCKPSLSADGSLRVSAIITFVAFQAIHRKFLQTAYTSRVLANMSPATHRSRHLDVRQTHYIFIRFCSISAPHDDELRAIRYTFHVRGKVVGFAHHSILFRPKAVDPRGEINSTNLLPQSTAATSGKPQELLNGYGSLSSINLTKWRHEMCRNHLVGSSWKATRWRERLHFNISIQIGSEIPINETIQNKLILTVYWIGNSILAIDIIIKGFLLPRNSINQLFVSINQLIFGQPVENFPL